MVSSSSSSSSSSASFSSVLPFGSNLNPLTLCLDRTNYNFWRSQVLPAVRAHNLEGILLGTNRPPAQFLDISASDGSPHVVRTVNPDFVLWHRQDQFLVSWLLSSMSESMLGHVTRCVCASEIWYTLERLHSTQSKARVLHMRMMLQTLKKGSMSIEEYIIKMKNIVDSINASGGQIITDDELVLYILGGLGNEYESVVVHLTGRQGSISLEETQLMLQTKEMRLEYIHINPFANLAHFRRGPNQQQVQYFQGGQDQNFKGKGRGAGGRGFGRGDRPICQLCGRVGHTAVKSYHRFNIAFQGSAQNSQVTNHTGANYASTSSHASGSTHQNFNQNQAYVASISAASDLNWYIDSGATNHMTAELENLNLNRSSYKGMDKLIVGPSNQDDFAGGSS